MKKLSVIAVATLLASPSYAWHAITITNTTDPVTVVSAIFTVKGVKAQTFNLDLPGGPGWFRVFGPLHEDGGPCLRHLTIVVSNPYFGVASQTAATKMNVCTETEINVSGVWPVSAWPYGGVGTAPLVITHR
jgi:hypothetical protein